MSSEIAIATADPGLFKALQQHLVAVRSIDPALPALSAQRVPSTQDARNWMELPERALLVLDAELPATPGKRRGRADPQGAIDLLNELDQTGITTPVLVVTPKQGLYPELEKICTPERHALALPSDRLMQHRQALLRPFLAMLLGTPDPNTGRIPNTFTAIEIALRREGSTCKLLTPAGQALQFGLACDLDWLRGRSSLYDSDSFHRDNAWWWRIARNDGEELFNRCIVEALGVGLFAHVESAAGGLRGLSFRFNIVDDSLYLAPFEASVRAKNGSLVLLSAPVVRQLPIGARLKERPIVPGFQSRFACCSSARRWGSTRMGYWIRIAARSRPRRMTGATRRSSRAFRSLRTLMRNSRHCAASPMLMPGPWCSIPSIFRTRDRARMRPRCFGTSSAAAATTSCITRGMLGARKVEPRI